MTDIQSICFRTVISFNHLIMHNIHISSPKIQLLSARDVIHRIFCSIVPYLILDVWKFAIIDRSI